MSKILFILVVSCLAYGILAENTCLSRCGEGCFVDFTRQLCRACPAGCSNCTNPDYCDVCAPGYYLNEEKNCVNCNVTGCRNCTAKGECTACQSGYFLANSSSCVYCGFMCEECESEKKCKKCRNDDNLYYGVYRSRRLGTCHYCPEGCKSCVSSGFCTSCKSGYTLSDFQCITCSTIDPACRNCNEEITQCTSCGPGRYLLNNTCLDCSSGCEECTDDSTCKKCMDGFFLNAHRGCTPCQSGCKECKNSLSCTKCYDWMEYDSEKGKCVSCDLGCHGVNTPIHPYPDHPIPLPVDLPLAIGGALPPRYHEMQGLRRRDRRPIAMAAMAKSETKSKVANAAADDGVDEDEEEGIEKPETESNATKADGGANSTVSTAETDVGETGITETEAGTKRTNQAASSNSSKIDSSNE